MLENTLNKAADKWGELDLLKKKDEKGDQDRGSEHGTETDEEAMDERVEEKLFAITERGEWLKFFYAFDGRGQVPHFFGEMIFRFNMIFGELRFRHGSMIL